MTLASLLLSFGLTLAQPGPPPITADSAMTVLAKGGYTLLWRHAATDHSVNDAPGFPNTERFQQRNLSDQGVADARMIGQIFKNRGIPIGDIITSPMYRTRETALYAFGRVTATSDALISINDTPEQKQLLLVKPAPGTNRLIVTHHFVIERHAPGIKPGDVGEGEIAIVKSDGEKLETIAVIKMSDWARMKPAESTSMAMMHGTPAGYGETGPSPRNVGQLTIPPAIHTQKNLVVAMYLHSFNQGTAAMRSFFEQWVVPNPERTIDQRMVVYDQLQKDLGKINIVSVDTSASNAVVVAIVGSTGRDAKVTVTIESATPYRAAAISVEYKR